MRHAKSDWGHADLSDHYRPLNPRGRRDAPRMAQWLESTWGLPDLILASTALRVQQTLDGMLGSWASQPTIYPHAPLYLASPETILQTIRADALDANHLLVVGHNPGMQILASQCADQPLEFPTAAAAVFRFNGDDWSTLTPGKLDLIGFNKPKALDLP